MHLYGIGKLTAVYGRPHNLKSYDGGMCNHMQDPERIQIEDLTTEEKITEQFPKEYQKDRTKTCFCLVDNPELCTFCVISFFSYFKHQFVLSLLRALLNLTDLPKELLTNTR